MAAQAASKQPPKVEVPEVPEVTSPGVRVRLLASSYHDGEKSYYRGDVFELPPDRAEHLFKVARLDEVKGGRHGAVPAEEPDEAPGPEAPAEDE